MAVYDPNVRKGENTLLPGGVQVATDVLTATTGTQVAVVMTEWSDIVESDWAALSRGMASPKFVFDGRNALDPLIMRVAGFEYVGVGRGAMPQDVARNWRNHKRTEDPECQR